MQFTQRDLTLQYISTSYQDVVQRYYSGSVDYLLDGLGYSLIGIPSSSIGGIVLTQDQTASYALTASYSNISDASTLSLSSSYSLNTDFSDTASFSVLAQFALHSYTASYILGNEVDGTVKSASYALSASWAPGVVSSVSSSWASSSISSSYSLSASWAPTVVSTTAISASWASSSISSSYSSAASYATFANSLDVSFNPLTASTVTYVERGAVSAADFILSSFTLDGVNRTKSLASIVPIGTIAVNLTIRVVSTNVDVSDIAFFNPTSNSPAFSAVYCGPQINNQFEDSNGITSIDSNRIIGYRGTGNFSVLNVVVSGWFVPTSSIVMANSSSYALTASSIPSNISVNTITASITDTLGFAPGIVTKTDNYILSSRDYTVIMSGSSVLSASLPSADTLNGWVFNIKNVTPHQVTVTGSQNIDGSGNQIITQWNTMTIQSNGVQWYTI